MEYTGMKGHILPAYDKDLIPIVAASSNYYAPYLGVLIQSIINHASNDKNYDIIVFESEISEENKALLCQLQEGHPNVSIRTYNPHYLFGEKNLYVPETLSVETYYKMVIPYLLDSYSKVLYLDVDMLVKRDVADLFEIDLTDFCLGAVLGANVHGAYNCMDAERAYFEEYIPLKNPYEYINTGLVLFNVRRCCEETRVEEIVRLSSSRNYKLPDQDVLNILYENKVKFLDYEWNIRPDLPMITIGIDNAPAGERTAYYNAKKNPYLIHWSGQPKAWVCPDVEYGGEWWQVAQQTPFMGAIIARMVDYMIHRNEYYANNKYNRVPELWSPNPLKLDPYRHFKKE